MSCAGQYIGYRDEEVSPESETETFVAIKCYVDNWRWAGVPFYLRTGKRMAESARIISIAFKEPPRSMFPPSSGVGDNGPDHLTFDLADRRACRSPSMASAPGPDDARQAVDAVLAAETDWAGAALEAYERLIYDAARGDAHPLHPRGRNRAALGDQRQPLLDSPPPIRPYQQGTWGPNQIHQLIAPFAWRLPFERPWRDPNAMGA